LIERSVCDTTAPAFTTGAFTTEAFTTATSTTATINEFAMRHVTLPNGRRVPALGLGTWHMGEDGRQRASEVNALRAGLDLGLTLIDTAEMYGDGGAEEVVGDAIERRRDQVVLVSKVYPHNASLKGTVAACERSLKRLKTDHLDLYLLHWRGSYALADTVAAFERLEKEGKIGGWGVSNFDVSDMAELRRVVSGSPCLTNQVLYHLGSRGIDWDLVPQTAAAGGTIMAYSPLGQGNILDDAALAKIAAKHGVTPAAVALAWTLRHPQVIAIPKASTLAHVKANAAAADLVLDAADLTALDHAFPPPRKAMPLGML
jgi:diketogulonate reductase-like aldo/keto reductase